MNILFINGSPNANGNTADLAKELLKGQHTLTGEEMSAICALDKKVRYYTSTPELLARYAQMVPPVDEQK